MAPARAALTEGQAAIEAARAAAAKEALGALGESF
jgi:hypothetical protein